MIQLFFPHSSKVDTSIKFPYSVLNMEIDLPIEHTHKLVRHYFDHQVDAVNTIDEIVSAVHNNGLANGKLIELSKINKRLFNTSVNITDNLRNWKSKVNDLTSGKDRQNLEKLIDVTEQFVKVINHPTMGDYLNPTAIYKFIIESRIADNNTDTYHNAVLECEHYYNELLQDVLEVK